MEDGATTHYLAMGHQVMYEKTGTLETRHIFAGNQRIAEVTNGTTRYFHNDHLGSPRRVTNSSGVQTAAIATKPFGEPHATSALTSYMFTGKDLDGTGLYYFAARYYDASVGRFTSPDPHWNHHNMIYGDNPDNKFPLISAITQSTNLYVYCANNPLGFVDLDGHIITPANVIGAVLGAGGGAVLGRLIADHYGLTGWKRNATIAGFGVGGAAVGWFTGPLVEKLSMSIAAKMGLIGAASGARYATSKLIENTEQLYTRYQSHIFSREHVINGIMQLGSDKVDIFNRLVNVVNQYASKVVEGSNQIHTMINGAETTIRFYVQNGQIISINAMVGHAQRIIGTLLK